MIEICDRFQVERLPFRVEPRLAGTLAFDSLEISPGERVLPHVRCVLTRPAATTLSLVVRIHSQCGIPLAHAAVDLRPGDCSFDTPVTLLAMEGYTHLGRRARRDVESRIWSRRSYAVVSAA